SSLLPHSTAGGPPKEEEEHPSAAFSGAATTAVFSGQRAGFSAQSAGFSYQSEAAAVVAVVSSHPSQSQTGGCMEARKAAVVTVTVGSGLLLMDSLPRPIDWAATSCTATPTLHRPKKVGTL
ncbi:unnamed protein product, partial [Ectocarpus sp. 12 AP-2014]